jgi:Tol biopolymer transport system component
VLASIAGLNTYDVAWSPDGSKVAFSGCCTAGNFEIYTMSADGTGLTQLTTDGRNTLPAWSPGGRLAFMTNRDGNYEIDTMNADGSSQADVSQSVATDENPAWSPDGQRIAFDSNRSGTYQVYTVKSAGADLIRLSTNAFNDTEPNYAPDGLTIVFQSSRTGKDQIFTMSSADGSGQTNLSNNAFNDDRPASSPDGTRIAFDSDRKGNREIYVMSSDGTLQADANNNSASDLRPDWQPLLPGPEKIAVSDTGFSPISVNASRGDTVEFDFSGTTVHTANDSSGMLLWGSGYFPPGGTYGFQFIAAGTYSAIDVKTGHTGTVLVGLMADPRAGNVDTMFTITWASSAPPPGYVFDVQIKRPYSITFTDWKTKLTTLSTTFVPDSGTGTYSFRARLRNTMNKKASGYSPPTPITVS